MSILRTRTDDTVVRGRLDRAAANSGFTNYSHLLECFKDLNVSYEGYASMDHSKIFSLHMLIAEGHEGLLQNQFARIRDEFFESEQGNRGSITFKLELKGVDALKLHPYRFAPKYVIDYETWVAFTAALTWMDEWSGVSFEGKGLLSRISIIQAREHSKSTPLATLDEVVDAGKTSKVHKIARASQGINLYLKSKEIGLVSFENYLLRSGLSRVKLETYLALRPGAEFDSGILDVIEGFYAEYRTSLAIGDLAATLALWGYENHFKEHNLLYTLKRLNSLRKSSKDVVRELEVDFLQLAPGDDLGFESYLSKVDRVHEELVESPRKEALLLRVEEEKRRVNALREFYQSDDAVQFTGRSNIEDKNPNQDV